MRKGRNRKPSPSPGRENRGHRVGGDQREVALGETLRRLPWREAYVEGEKLAVRLQARDFERLEELPRDQWPGR